MWGYFVKALYLSWIWFLVSFYTDLGQAARILALALSVIVALRLLSPRPFAASAPKENQLWRGRRIVSVLAFVVIAMPALSSFGTVFSVWDAVVSWNRWGVELSRNEYEPYNAAYPILWPAVWSLIYEAQGSTTLWFIAKASIAAPLLATAFLIADQIKRPHLVSGAILALLAALVFSTQTSMVVSGYMDLPLAMTGLGALVLLIHAVDEPFNERRDELFMLAVITSAVAIITKQAGIIFAGIVGLCLLYETFLRRVAITKLLLYGLIVFFPLVAYLHMYFGLEANAFGNFDFLNQVADKNRGDAGEFQHATALFRDAFPSVVWPILFVGIILNLIFVRSYKGVIGLLCLGAGLVTFTIFATCCAYGIRNGYLVMSFAMASAFIGYSSAEAWASKKKPALALAAPPEISFSLRTPLAVSFLAAVVALLVLTLEWPEQRLSEYDRKIRPEQLGYGFPNKFLMDHSEEIEKAPLLASPYMIAGYLPLTEEKFLYCPKTNASCIQRAKKAATGASILVFSPENFEDEGSKAFIAESLAAGRAKIISRSGPLTLYSFKIE